MQHWLYPTLLHHTQHLFIEQSYRTLYLQNSAEHIDSSVFSHTCTTNLHRQGSQRLELNYTVLVIFDPPMQNYKSIKAWREGSAVHEIMVLRVPSRFKMHYSAMPCIYMYCIAISTAPLVHVPLFHVFDCQWLYFYMYMYTLVRPMMYM